MFKDNDSCIFTSHLYEEIKMFIVNANVFTLPGVTSSVQYSRYHARCVFIYLLYYFIIIVRFLAMQNRAKPGSRVHTK